MCEKYQSIVGLFISDIKRVDFLLHFLKKKSLKMDIFLIFCEIFFRLFTNSIYTCLLNRIQVVRIVFLPSLVVKRNVAEE
jgi:hypothetical protein